MSDPIDEAIARVTAAEYESPQDLTDAKVLAAECERLRSAIKQTIDRWSEETGDGSMWGEDAWVLAPIAEAAHPGWSPGQRKSGEDYQSECERLRERCSVLEEALRPFAESWDRYHDANLGDAKHYEAARLALEGK